MTTATSAGILLYRRRSGRLEVFLGHPGGPFYRRRDEGVWSIPKGEIDPGEDFLAAARREFREETGFDVDGAFLALPVIRQKSGKRVHAFAVEGDVDPARLRSNTFDLEWPPRSGRVESFPEIDRGDWFTIDQARLKILAAQSTLLDELVGAIEPGGDDSGDGERLAADEAGTSAR